MNAAYGDTVDAYNYLGDVVDFLKVLGMALASEDGAEPFPRLATVLDVALERADLARDAAKRAMEYHNSNA